MRITMRQLSTRRTAWLVLAAILLGLDYVTLPAIQFPFTFIFPVTLAAWNRRPIWAYAFAILLPLARFSFNFLWIDVPWSTSVSIINLLIRVGVLALFTAMTLRIASQYRDLQKKCWRLEGLLPICMTCRSVRDERNDWQSIEKYLSTRTDVIFSHRQCPACSGRPDKQDSDLLSHYDAE